MNARVHFALTATWFVVGLLMLAFFYELFGWLWVAALPVYFGIFAVGLVWSLVGLGSWRRSKARPLLVSSVGTFLLTVFLWRYGAAMGQHIYFLTKQDAFARIVAEIKQTGRAGLTPIKHEVEGRSPLRVRFIRYGFVDNYATVIYDEGDSLRVLSDYRGRLREGAKTDRTIRELRSIFGGDVVSCRRLRKGWYYCTFT